MRKLPSGTSILSVSITGKKSISSYLDTSIRLGEMELDLMLPKGNVGVNTALVSSWEVFMSAKTLKIVDPNYSLLP